jgi:hypothetical protein
MTKLDLVLERIRRLPPERQDAMAVQMEMLVEDEETGVSLLTDEQWAEVEAALADEDEAEIPHEQVFAELRAKYPQP